MGAPGDGWSLLLGKAAVYCSFSSSTHLVSKSYYGQKDRPLLYYIMVGAARLTDWFSMARSSHDFTITLEPPLHTDKYGPSLSE